MSIDALLAARLERTSLSPRGRFISALNSNNLDAIIHELSGDTSECTPLVLAACLFAILPKADDVPDLVADILLKLSNRLITSEKCSRKSWDELVALLAKEKLNPEMLADFLSRTVTEKDAVDEKFLSLTWSLLSKCLQLHKVPSILDKVPVAGWINSFFLSPDEPVSVLAFVYYSCSNREDDFDQEAMFQEDGCRQFLLKSIAQCENLQNSFPMVEIVLQNDITAFMETSSRETLLLLATFYERQKTVGFSFLCSLFAKLNRPEDDEVIKTVLAKEWIADPIKIEENQPDYIFLIESLLQKVSEAADKCLTLFLATYCNFADDNCKHLKRLSDRQCDFRINVSLLIKERLIKTLFYIYSRCLDKNASFERLEKALLDCRVTLQGPEPKVFKVLEEEAMHLIYLQERITHGKSALM